MPGGASLRGYVPVQPYGCSSTRRFRKHINAATRASRTNGGQSPRPVEYQLTSCNAALDSYGVFTFDIKGRQTRRRKNRFIFGIFKLFPCRFRQKSSTAQTVCPRHDRNRHI